MSADPLMPDNPGLAYSPKQAEVSSGKNAAYENFPVGSWLLSKKNRRHIVAFYAYARAIDDIADSAELSARDKIHRLDAHALAVRGETPAGDGCATARDMRESLLATGITARHCVDLTRAFKQDATKLRYRDWSELMDYCYKSAAPVGRYLIDLHGEPPDTYPASDALCNALQVLNHLQDCKEDYKDLDRVYLPQDWMREAGASVESLASTSATAQLRRVLDSCLDASENLLSLANELPRRIRDRRFAMEAATIVQVAKKLARKLRRRDPLAKRVVLSPPQYMNCFAYGILSGLARARGPQSLHAAQDQR